MKNLIPNTRLNTAMLVVATSAALSSYATPPAGVGPDVTVANTSTNPVPVVQQGPVSISGDITLGGTPNVKVVNASTEPLPVVQKGPISIAGGVTVNGTPTVTVANTPTVTVVNGTAQPLPVRSVDVVVPQPFAASWLFSLGTSWSASYTVPSNKRAIVEFVGFRSFSSMGYFVEAVIGARTGGTACSHHLDVTWRTDFANAAISAASQVVRIYADPGTQIGIGTGSVLVADPPLPQIEASISGVLVDP